MSSTTAPHRQRCTVLGDGGDDSLLVVALGWTVEVGARLAEQHGSGAVAPATRHPLAQLARTRRRQGNGRLAFVLGGAAGDRAREQAADDGMRGSLKSARRWRTRTRKELSPQPHTRRNSLCRTSGDAARHANRGTARGVTISVHSTSPSCLRQPPFPPAISLCPRCWGNTSFFPC